MLWFSMFSLFAADKEPHLCWNLDILSHKTKKDEEATVVDLPRTATVTTKGLWSPLAQHSLVLLSSPRVRQLRGIYGESKYTQLGLVRAKRSKNLQKMEKNHSLALNRKKEYRLRHKVHNFSIKTQQNDPKMECILSIYQSAPCLNHSMSSRNYKNLKRKMQYLLS